jgi:hypothetical protein
MSNEEFKIFIETLLKERARILANELCKNNPKLLGLVYLL